MQIKTLNNIESFLQIKEAWRKIYLQGTYSVFQSFELNYYSWKHEMEADKSNKLAVTLITKEDNILAIFPFYVDNNKQLRFINDLHFDFCDFISIESINFFEVYNYLKKEINFKSINLINIKKEANIYKAISDLNITNKVVKLISEYSTVCLDQGNFPYNVKHYRSHEKHRINKAIRTNKDKRSLILDSLKSSFPKKEILFLRDRMIRLGLRKESFLTNQRLLLIESLFNSGIIILNLTRDTERINCINILFRNSSNEFIFWIDLFDDSKTINISSYINFMKFYSLKRSININFGRGRYFYKESNFSPKFHNLYQICIFSNKWQKIIFYIIDNLSVLLKRIYKKFKK